MLQTHKYIYINRRDMLQKVKVSEADIEYNVLLSKIEGNKTILGEINTAHENN